MGSVEKRIQGGKVTWLARWRDLDGHSRKRSFRRKADAERYVAAIQDDLYRGVYVDPNRGKVTVAEWATAWLASLGHLRPAPTPATRESWNATSSRSGDDES